ncbi:YidC/Oxa1 family membrane protein insertase [soil metagenome]
MGNIFDTVIIHPILNILVGFYKLFIQIGLPGAFGFAIIAITLSVRILMHPFFKQQMATAKKMKDIKPHLDHVQKKHKGDAKKLQAEQMRLYQEAGINPAAGCVFAVIQIPLFMGLYRTLQLFLSHGADGKAVQLINEKLYYPFLKIQSLDPHFFGLNLAISPSQGHAWGFYLVPLVTGGLQFLQNKVTMGDQAPVAPKKDELKEITEDGKKEEKAPSSTADEFQKAMTTQMKYVFPVMIGYFSYSLPLGLSLYWNLFSLFSIIQYYSQHKNNAKSEVKPLKLKS